MDMTVQSQRNKEAADNPTLGDYWHEMCCPVCVVVDVLSDGDLVVMCPRRNGDDVAKRITRDEFIGKLKYSLADNADWCADVSVNKDIIAVENYVRLGKKYEVRPDPNPPIFTPLSENVYAVTELLGFKALIEARMGRGYEDTEYSPVEYPVLVSFTNHGTWQFISIADIRQATTVLKTVRWF